MPVRILFFAPFLALLAATGISAAADTPAWDFDAALRLRTEYLDNSFRLVAPASDQMQLSRLELAAHYRQRGYSVDVEIQDSRAWGAEALSPLGNDDVNSLEPINVKVGRSWTAEEGQQISVELGRMTIDYGSRRLLARNGFRNTSNAFQGLLARYRADGVLTQLFYTYPLQRLPTGLEREELRDNGFELDRAGRNERFWGISHDRKFDAQNGTISAYLFGRELTDRPGRPVADRELLTLGARGTRRWHGFDAELEAAYQWGTSSAGAASNKSLSHRAWFTHLHLGYDLNKRLNLRLGYDLASGDRNPDDGINQRFDRLYGARAFELGPSGMFGAALRSNLRAPVLQLRAKTGERHKLLFSYRTLHLDSARDAYVPGGRRDISGSSGRDLGDQWELRWRYRQRPDSGFSLELGGAYLDKGGYFNAGPGAPLLNPPSPGDSRYLFVQLGWRY